MTASREVLRIHDLCAFSFLLGALPIPGDAHPKAILSGDYRPIDPARREGLLPHAPAVVVERPWHHGG